MNSTTSTPNAPLRPAPAIHGNKLSYLNRKKSSERHLLLIILFDFLLLNVILLFFLNIQTPVVESIGFHSPRLLLLMITINFSWITIAAFTDVYGIFEGVKLNLKIKNLFLSALIFFGVSSLIYYQFFYSIFGVHFLLPAFFCFIVLSSMAHLAIRYYNRDKTGYLSYAVIGGKPSSLRYLRKAFEAIYGANTFCVGRFADKDIPGVIKLGDFEDIEHHIIRNNNFNKLIYFHSNLPKESVRHIVQLCRSRFIDFEVIPDEIDFFSKGTQVEQLSYLPILRRKKEPLCRLENKILKRTFDLVFSLLAVILIIPWLFPLIALLIKLESNGPVFFSQERTGYWNKPFKCYKFRTMRVNKDSDSKQATVNDARITRIGSLLRKTNMDELPQFFNVLRGEMSVVGPRPHMLKHTEDYSKLIETYMIRHEVKPGITGWAQVSGWRGPTEEVYKMAKRVEYDVSYIENWSFWFDCKCIMLTVANVFKGEENAV